MQESRLFKILYYLLDKGRATAPELAAKFEVSARTVYRDIDALSEAGIPVYAEMGRGGGFRLLDGFVLNKAVLSDKEKQDILAAMQNLSIANSDYAQDSLRKLSALFHLPAQDWYEIDFSRWGGISSDNEKFETLKYAIIHHQSVRILYFGSNGEQKERVVCPVKLRYKSKEWYLNAFCQKRQDFRLFKLNRIMQYTLLPEQFSPADFPMPETSPQTNDEQTCKIRLRFTKAAAYRVYDEFDNSRITWLDNGDMIVCADMPNDAWLIGYLLSFGTQVDILEPVSLRDAVTEEAEKIYLKKKDEKNKI